MYLSHITVQALLDLEKSILKLSLGIEQTANDKIKHETLTKNLFYFARSLSLHITIKEAERLIAGGKIATADEREELITNYINTNKVVDSLALNIDQPINAQSLLEIQKLLLDKISNPNEEGFRLSANRPIEKFGDLSSLLSPEYIQVSGQQAISSIFAEMNRDTTLPEIIRIGMTILLLLRAQPLKSLNEYSICLLTDAMLKRYLKNIPLYWSSMEFFHEQKSNLLLTAGKISTEESLELWLDLFLSHIANRYVPVAGSIQIGLNKTGKPSFLDLNKRQLRILKYLQTIPSIKREDYVQMTEVSPMTAYRDLQQLLENKLLKTYGTGRGTKYMLANR